MSDTAPARHNHCCCNVATPYMAGHQLDILPLLALTPPLKKAACPFFPSLLSEPPPQPELPQPKVEEKTEPKALVAQPLQAMAPPKPRLLQAPELDYAPPQVALNMAVTGPPTPLTDLSGVYRPDELDQAPTLNFHVKPLYPYRAKRMNISGHVVVEFAINTDGEVGQIRIVESEPQGVFDAAVLEAVSKWRFQPGELLGDRVATRMVKKIVFKLEE